MVSWELSNKGKIVLKHRCTEIIIKEFVHLSEKKETKEAIGSQDISYPVVGEQMA